MTDNKPDKIDLDKEIEKIREQVADGDTEFTGYQVGYCLDKIAELEKEKIVDKNYIDTMTYLSDKNAALVDMLRRLVRKCITDTVIGKKLICRVCMQTTREFKVLRPIDIKHTDNCEVDEAQKLIDDLKKEGKE